MFTFKKSKNNYAIAKVIKGLYNNKILYLNNVENTLSDSTEADKTKHKKGNTYCEYCDKNYSDPSNLTRHKNYHCPQKSLNEIVQYEVSRILNMNKSSSESDSDDEIIEKVKLKTKIKNNESFDKLIIDGKFQPLPNPEKRDILYIAGATDSGKTHYISEYIKEFKKMFPDKDIFIFSRVQNDENLDKIKGIKRIMLDEELYLNPIDCKKHLSNSLCIFDDIDSIQDSKISNAIEKLQTDILLCGRDQTNQGNDIYIICTSHQASDYKRTRQILNEATNIILFPQSTGAWGLNRVLKYYVGLDSKQAQSIIKEPSRWINLHRRFPMYMITENKIITLNKIT